MKGAVVTKWNAEMRERARAAFLTLTGENETYDKHDLKRQIISEVAANLKLEVDEDALGDDLDLLDLLPGVLGVAADDSPNGGSYRAYEVLAAPDGSFLVIDDLMEEGALVRIATTHTLAAACKVIGEHSAFCLGQNGYLYFDGTEVDLEASPVQEEAFWASVLLGDNQD